MKNKKKTEKCMSPPADIILDIINDEKGATEKMLNFYDEYITAGAKEHIYSEDGRRLTTIINDDLLQDIREDIIKAIPTLRKSILNGRLGCHPLVVIVAAGSEIFE